MKCKWILILEWNKDRGQAGRKCHNQKPIHANRLRAEYRCHSARAVKIMLWYISTQSCLSMPPPSLAIAAECMYFGGLPLGRWVAKSWTGMALVCLHQIQLKAWFMRSLTGSPLTNCWAADISQATVCTIYPPLTARHCQNYKTESRKDLLTDTSGVNQQVSESLNLPFSAALILINIQAIDSCVYMCGVTSPTKGLISLKLFSCAVDTLHLSISENRIKVIILKISIFITYNHLLIITLFTLYLICMDAILLQQPDIGRQSSWLSLSSSNTVILEAFCVGHLIYMLPQDRCLLMHTPVLCTVLLGPFPFAQLVNNHIVCWLCSAFRKQLI